MSDEKTIRFIDSSYNTLFYVPDGGNIVLTYSDGEKVIRPCKFLDEYHTQIGSSIFHICEFAERMEQNGTSYVPEKPPELPDRCFATLPSSGELIMITKGEKGYQKCSFSTNNPITNQRMADDYNLRNQITRQQAAAMLGGSMFGWSTPAARTSSYDLRGRPIKPSRNKANKPRASER